MKSKILDHHFHFKNQISERNLLEIIIIIFIGYLYWNIIKNCSTRRFNYDEFQVIYESFSILKGKAIYSENISVHFPFLDIFVSFFIRMLNCKLITIIVVRYIILLFSLITTLYVFKIAKIFWNTQAGLVSIALTLSCIVFIQKGIEIRHDVFGMTFTIIGLYYIVRYFETNNLHVLVLSSLSIGLSIASTQKSFIWLIGIVFGIALYLIRLSEIRKFFKILIFYFGSISIMILINFGYLFYFNNENLDSFIKANILTSIAYIIPDVSTIVYPFPHPKTKIFFDLLYKNGPFYVFSILMMLMIFFRWLKYNTKKIILFGFAIAGIVYYLCHSRPFFQNLLPVTPIFAILASGLIIEIRKRIQALRMWNKRIIIYFILIVFIPWPIYLIESQNEQNNIFNIQMQNILFCLNNLELTEKPFCLSQNQIYFDPVMTLYDQKCGKNIFDMERKCFEQQMKINQCKVIIVDDYITFLPKDVKDAIAENYLLTEIGSILIPGFILDENTAIEKAIWIKGKYYSSSNQLKVNGEYQNNNIFYLDTGKYFFENLKNEKISIYYIFN